MTSTSANLLDRAGWVHLLYFIARLLGGITFQSWCDGATLAVFGIGATWTPRCCAGRRVRVIARRPDTIVGFGETRVHAETATFELRASDLANPRPGDQLTVGAETFVIQGEPERRDPNRLVWTLDTRPT